MELTITQTGALYALQHGATKKYRVVRPKPVEADLTRALPTLTAPIEKRAMRPVPAREFRPARQNTLAELVDAFPEYRVAA
jgi:hypothetical protein